MIMGGLMYDMIIDLNLDFNIKLNRTVRDSFQQFVNEISFLAKKKKVVFEPKKKKKEFLH
mgnify:CR=1 FL=1